MRGDPQLSARLLRDLKKAGLVPVMPDNEEDWFLEIQGSTAEDGKVSMEGSGTLGHGSRTTPSDHFALHNSFIDPHSLSCHKCVTVLVRNM